MCDECESLSGELTIELINHISEFAERYDLPTDAGQASDITARAANSALGHLLRMIAADDPVHACELRTEAMIALSPNCLDLRPAVVVIPANATMH